MDRVERINTDRSVFRQGVDPQKYPTSESMTSGHLACPGCGAAMAMRMALKAVEKNNLVVVIPACCWSVIPGPFPYTNLEFPLMHCAFETAASTASGIRAALDMQNKHDTTVLCWAGDGGTFDIGLQALSSAAERNENILYICYDNEAYMNTGIQRSSATPLYAWTTDTPTSHPKLGAKKSIHRIMAAHNIPYIATATPAFPHDLMLKFKKAMGIKGTRFIHILSSCIPGWKIESSESVEIMRLAVETKMFPIYEIFDGEKTIINIEPKCLSVEGYLKKQGRFKHLNKEQISDIQKLSDKEWERLTKGIT